MKFIPLELGQPGLTYMENWYEGWDRLAKSAVVFMSKFRHCLAFVPEGTSLERAQEYKTGGLDGGATPVFIDYLVSVFKKNPTYCFVVMDHSKDSEYPRMENTKGVFYYENQLYEYINNKMLTPSILAEKLDSLSFFGMGFVIDATIDPTTAEKQFVSKAVFEDLAANIRMAFIGAYDDESYLLAF